MSYSIHRMFYENINQMRGEVKTITTIKGV